MPTIHTLTGISSIELGGHVYSGPMADGTKFVQVTPADIKPALDRIQALYPLPADLDIYLLPFNLTKVDGIFMMADGVASAQTADIYIGALCPIDYVEPQLAYKAVIKFLAHEIGHAIHFRYLPPPTSGWIISGPWDTFEKLMGYEGPNNSYEVYAHEDFAECWRLIFCPETRDVPHRHNRIWNTYEMWAWMRSLNGDLVLKENDLKMYQSGQILQAPVPPQIISDRMMIPIRIVSEQMGLPVQWDYDHEATIVYKRPTSS